MVSPNSIKLETVVKVSEKQVSADLADEAAILHLKSGVYYGLNRVGAFIWNCIEEPTRVADICAQVSTKFEVASEQCERDVIALLQNLAEQDLIEFLDESQE
jgi:hypothetical protein